MKNNYRFLSKINCTCIAAVGVFQQVMLANPVRLMLITVTSSSDPGFLLENETLLFTL